MAQVSLALSQQDTVNQTPIWRAFERFNRTLDASEKAAFTNITLQEVLMNVRHLDQVHASSSKSRRFTHQLEPFFNFLDRHARALDAMAQVQPRPSALIWGIVRVILEVTLSLFLPFEYIV
jgi:site-specific recombinase XerD